MQRVFSISSLLLLLCFFLVPIAAAQAPNAGQQDGRVWLDRARDVQTWLDGLRDQTGRTPVDAMSPGSYRDDLAAGDAGRLLFARALYDATGDYEALHRIREAADGLVSRLPDQLLEGFPPTSGFYYGIAGIGFALHQAYLSTGDAVYRERALHCVRILIDGVQVDDEGRPYWSDRFDEVMFGNTGTALFLLYAATEMNYEPALAVARAHGDRLLAIAQREGRRLNWPMRSDRPEMILPNFSHGAAGIGYFLATLHMATGERRYLEAAVGAAATLEELAVIEHGGVLFPYGFPNESWEGRFDLGWAHGVAGTARLFQRLHQITGERRFDRVVEECSVAIARSNAPQQAAPGYELGSWSLDRRFGFAGVAEFLASRYRERGDRSQLDAAREFGRFIFEAGRVDQPGLYWVSPRPSFAERPGEDAQFTGWFTGATGFGMLFLELDAIERGAPRVIMFPDDPLAYIPTP